MVDRPSINPNDTTDPTADFSKWLQDQDRPVRSPFRAITRTAPDAPGQTRVEPTPQVQPGSERTGPPQVQPGVDRTAVQPEHPPAPPPQTESKLDILKEQGRNIRRLTISPTDINLDDAIKTSDYTRLQVNDQTLNVQIDVDQNGYFFRFVRTDNNAALDDKRHYLPPQAKEMCVNGRTFNLEDARLLANERLANFELGKILGQDVVAKTPYFTDFLVPPGRVSAADAQNFVKRLSLLPADVLAAEDRSLKQSVDTFGTNPYFKIYLADIRMAELMKPVAEGTSAPNGGMAKQVRSIVTDLQFADSLSRDGLARFRQVVPPGNDVQPLAPHALFDDPGSIAAGYKTYAGSENQAAIRVQAYTRLSDALASGISLGPRPNQPLPAPPMRGNGFRNPACSNPMFANNPEFKDKCKM